MTCISPPPSSWGWSTRLRSLDQIFQFIKNMKVENLDSKSIFYIRFSVKESFPLMPHLSWCAGFFLGFPHRAACFVSLFIPKIHSFFDLRRCRLNKMRPSTTSTWLQVAVFANLRFFQNFDPQVELLKRMKKSKKNDQFFEFGRDPVAHGSLTAERLMIKAWYFQYTTLFSPYSWHTGPVFLAKGIVLKHSLLQIQGHGGSSCNFLLRA